MRTVTLTQVEFQPDAEQDTPAVFTVPTKPCCGVLVGDCCDCAGFALSAASAPEIRVPAGAWGWMR